MTKPQEEPDSRSQPDHYPLRVRLSAPEVTVRSSPSLDSSKICQLKQGARFSVVTESENGWIRIRTRTNRDGYIPDGTHFEALDPIDLAEQSPLQAARREHAFRRAMGLDKKAKVCIALVLANVLVAVPMFLQSSGWTSLRTLLKFGASFAPYFEDGDWYRLITCMFVHVGFMHILVNMIALFSLGGFLEATLGRVSFLLLYFASGFSGAALSVVWNSHVVSAGASGAVFGILGCLVVITDKDLQPEYAHELRTIRRQAITISVLNLALGFLVPAIDNAAHLGGFIAGVALGACHHFLGAQTLLKRALLPAGVWFTLVVAWLWLCFPSGIAQLHGKLVATAELERVNFLVFDPENSSLVDGRRQNIQTVSREKHYRETLTAVEKLSEEGNYFYRRLGDQALEYYRMKVAAKEPAEAPKRSKYNFGALTVAPPRRR